MTLGEKRCATLSPAGMSVDPHSSLSRHTLLGVLKVSSHSLEPFIDAEAEASREWSAASHYPGEMSVQVHPQRAWLGCGFPGEQQCVASPPQRGPRPKGSAGNDRAGRWPF